LGFHVILDGACAALTHPTVEVVLSC